MGQSQVHWFVKELDLNHQKLAWLIGERLRRGGIEFDSGPETYTVGVGGSRPLWELASGTSDQVVSRIVMQERPTSLLDRATQTLDDVEVEIKQTRTGITIADGSRVAEVWPTGARVPATLGMDSRVARADYFASTHAWAILRRAFLPGHPPRRTEVAARPVPHSEKILTDATSATPVQRASMQLDSLRLRNSRETAMSRVVTLHVSGSADETTTLTVHPVRAGGSTGTAYEIPVAVQATSGASLYGALRLSTPVSAPILAFIVEDPGGLRGATLESYWALALRAAADLLCVERIAQSARQRAGVPSRVRRGNSGHRRAIPQAPKRLSSGSFTTPLGWHPTAETEALVQSIVVGHRRRIPGSASAAARRRAARHSIALPTRGATWVEPHIRGAGEHDGASPLVFEWTAPVELLAELDSRPQLAKSLDRNS